jgi:uncharacterized protein (TIGR02757 family)
MPPNKIFFENLYKKYNKRKYVFSDPINTLYAFKGELNIEIAGLIASSLAYGNVKQILKSLNMVFSSMGASPEAFLRKTRKTEIVKSFSNFKHRFTTAKEFSDFLINIKKSIESYGSIENMFLRHFKKDEDNLSNSIYSFIKEFSACLKTPTLIPSPEKKSSFKRFNLFLRWMIRKDEIDLGIWKKIPASKLIIPVDTHILAVSQKLGITSRKDSSMKTALEITDFFKKINPSDPIKYDFSITRKGILKNFQFKD